MGIFLSCKANQHLAVHAFVPMSCVLLRVDVHHVSREDVWLFQDVGEDWFCSCAANGIVWNSICGYAQMERTVCHTLGIAWQQWVLADSHANGVLCRAALSYVFQSFSRFSSMIRRRTSETLIPSFLARSLIHFICGAVNTIERWITGIAMLLGGYWTRLVLTFPVVKGVAYAPL